MSGLKKILLLTLGFLFITSLPSQAADKRFQVKRGYIKYNVSGQNNGTEELYFDDYGARQARYAQTTMKMFGFKQETNTVHIVDGDWAYNIDLNENTGTRVNYKEMMEKMKEMMGSQGGFFGYSEAELKEMGRKVGTEKILGKTCNIWEMTDFGSKLWEYHGLPLKTQTDMMGVAITTEAVAFEENARIDAAKLALPDGVKIEDAEMPEMTAEEQEKMRQGMEAMRQFRQSEDYEQFSEQMQEANQQVEQEMQAQGRQEMDVSEMEETKGKAMKKAVGGLLKSLF